MTRRPARFYSFLLAIVPVVHRAAANPGWWTIGDLAPVLVTVLAGGALVYGLAALVARGRWGGRLPPLVVLAAALWFWGYVPLVDLVGRRASVATHLMLFPLGIAVTVGLGWWLLHRPAALDRVAIFLTLTGGLLVGWSALSIGMTSLRNARAPRQSAVVRRLAQPIPVQPGAAAKPRRDIYLIILDEYANAETTRARFGFDNQVFLDSLRRLGFVVPAVRSNYFHTVLSIPSLLNATHLADLSRELGRTKDPTVPDYLVQNNRTVAFLKSHGYGFAFFPSQWWLATRENRHADWEADVWDEWHPAREMSRSHFRRELRRMSMLDLLAREAAWNINGDHVTRTFTAIAQVPKMPGPVFAFAHLLIPHRPFVFDRDCRPPPREAVGRPSQSGTMGYVEQVECLSKMVLKLVSTLLRESDVPPVILLQGDHGTGTLRFDTAATAEAIPAAAVHERLGAFGAYYLPDRGTDAFGDSVTVVNVLGNVLRHYFGAALPREPEDMYISVPHAPYALKRVDCAWLATCQLRGE